MAPAIDSKYSITPTVADWDYFEVRPSVAGTIKCARIQWLSSLSIQVEIRFAIELSLISLICAHDEPILHGFGRLNCWLGDTSLYTAPYFSHTRFNHSLIQFRKYPGEY